MVKKKKKNLKLHSHPGITIPLLWQFWIEITGESISQESILASIKVVITCTKVGFPNNDIMGIPLTDKSLKIRQDLSHNLSNFAHLGPKQGLKLIKGMK